MGLFLGGLTSLAAILQGWDISKKAKQYNEDPLNQMRKDYLPALETIE